MFEKPENRLLASLEPVDLSLLNPHLRTRYFAKGAILQEQEAPVAEVYFPLNGMVALVSVMENGQIVESALVGREGALACFPPRGGPNLDHRRSHRDLALSGRCRQKRAHSGPDP